MSKAQVSTVGAALVGLSFWVGVQIGGRDPIAWVFLALLPAILVIGLVVLWTRGPTSGEIASKVEALSKRVASIEAALAALENERK